jgi:hypothetical protein
MGVLIMVKLHDKLLGRKNQGETAGRLCGAGREIPRSGQFDQGATLVLSVFVVFPLWNAECLMKCNDAAEIFLGTNAYRFSSTRSTKQLVSVRRPFPQ